MCNDDVNELTDGWTSDNRCSSDVQHGYKYNCL
jgi:hypothetical protein